MNEEINPDKLRKGMRSDIQARVAITMARQASILDPSVRQVITDHVVTTVCLYLSELFGPMA